MQDHTHVLSSIDGLSLCSHADQCIYMYDVSYILHSLFPPEEGTFHHDDLGDADQRLALSILNQKKFVPEHVENRTLYNPMQPHMSQVCVCVYAHVRVCMHV